VSNISTKFPHYHPSSWHAGVVILIRRIYAAARYADTAAEILPPGALLNES
jgi:hypothetical protein